MNAMLRHAHFLKAILDAPDDDAPRLIYADWLDEEGDSDRAEFIRLQCVRERMQAADPRRPACLAREQSLLAEHGPRWAGPLRWVVSSYRYRRGFIEQVAADGQTFLDHARTLFEAAPVRAVRLRGAGPVIGPLAMCPYLARLTALELRGSYHDAIGPAGARELAQSPFVAGLTALDLPQNNLGAAGAAALAASPFLAAVTSLSLRQNGVRTEGVRALAGSPLFAHLTRLDLSDNHIGADGVTALVSGPPPKALRALSLSFNYHAVFPLGHAVVDPDTSVATAGAIALASWLGLAPLASLGLRLCGITDPGARALAASPHLANVEALYLSDNAIGDSARDELRARFGDRVFV
jgi:uncharacterized protein (TIGR02996 family)